MPNVTEREIPNTNQIGLFFHCVKCLEEKPEGVSPREFVRLEVGWTALGIQVWCIRHELNVIHLDFMDQKVRGSKEAQFGPRNTDH